VRFAQTLLLGVSLGAIYALIALGFVLIFKGTKVINLAQGSIMLLGVYVVAVVSPNVGFLLAVLAGLATAVTGSVLIERVIAQARTKDHLVATILTIGVDIVLATEIARRLGPRVLTMGDPWGDATVTVGGLTIPQARIAATVLALVLIATFFLVFTRSDWGVRMRASAEDRETAALMGISQRRIAMSSWAIGGALALTAGIFLAGFPNPGLDHTAHLLASIFHAILFWCCRGTQPA
jgi:branched-chain amino acid transport system permease protein